ncbi:MAG TPA: zf-HC2 domain-containing protein [Gemmatimonadaceae bacterium]|nr:zf-HC2 domain-containing protein [Gemmatimonadaceae bacterium]
MNKCVEVEIQDMLPDLLHKSLDASARARVEAHVATCAACTEELSVLRAVQAAAVFAPRIDVDRVVGHIPPYRAIRPVAGAPTRSRVVSWLVAASLLVVVAGGGSLLMIQQNASVPRGTTVSPSDQLAILAPAVVNTPSPENPAVGVSQAPAHALALAAGVEELSDNDLRQLMTDMNNFDALPSAEPEPVFAVETGDNPQGF